MNLHFFSPILKKQKIYAWNEWKLIIDSLYDGNEDDDDDDSAKFSST